MELLELTENFKKLLGISEFDNNFADAFFSIITNSEKLNDLCENCPCGEYQEICKYAERIEEDESIGF